MARFVGVARTTYSTPMLCMIRREIYLLTLLDALLVRIGIICSVVSWRGCVNELNFTEMS